MELMECKLHPEISAPHKMELEDLKKITNQFSDELILGHGGFGIVYKGEKENGELVAVKRLKNMERMDDKQFVNEVKHVMDIFHPNIVRPVGYCYQIEGEFMMYNGSQVLVDKVERLLCFEYLPNGSLDKHIADESCGLDWHERYNIIKGICMGLHCLHEGRRHAPILHLDLKPSNVMLDKNMMPKIADFGMSRLFGEGETHSYTKNIIGSRGYMAPEYSEAGLLRKESDIYSLGVIIVEIVTGHRRYPEDVEELIEAREKWRRRIKRTSKSKATWEVDCQQVNKCIEVGLKCMERDPKKRHNIREILEVLVTSESSDSRSVEEDSFIQIYSHAEPLEEQAKLLQRPNMDKMIGQPLEKNTAKKSQLLAALKFKTGYIFIRAIAIAIVFTVLAALFMSPHQISIAVDDTLLTRFTLATSPATTLAYNLSSFIRIHNPNRVMSIKHTKQLLAAWYFDGQMFDLVLLASKGSEHPAGRSRLYHVIMSSESDYVRLGDSGVAEYNRETTKKVIEMKFIVTGEIMYTGHYTKCKLEATCPLILSLVPRPILNGLDGSYNDLVSSVNANSGTTLDDLFSQMCAHDLRREMLSETGPDDAFTSSVNAAARGRDYGRRARSPDGRRGYSPDGRRGRSSEGRRGRSPDGRGDRGYDRRDQGGQGRRRDGGRREDGGRRDGRPRDDGQRRRDDGGRRRDDAGRRDDGGQGRRRGHGHAPTPFIDVTCQICKIHGHPASDCWWRYQDDSDDDGDRDRNDKATNYASYGVDTNWYADSGATDHAAGELSKLSVHEKYKGRDRVQTADSNGNTKNSV